MSLVGLDGVIACFHYDTLNLKRIEPKLIRDDVSRDEIETTLNNYAKRDDVPRVTRAVQTIAAKLDSIVDSPF